MYKQESTELARKLAGKLIDGVELAKLRTKNNENQSEFWGRLGVIQGAASRYERGHPMPFPLRVIATIRYGTKPRSQMVLQALQINV